MTCPKCGAKVPQSTDPGRPLTYCSTGCRRATEYELRRLQKALEDVEDRLRWSRINGRTPVVGERLEVERLTLEARLHVLLDHAQTTDQEVPA